MNPELEDILAGIASEGEVLYRPNPGNAGDSLIAHATYRMFRKAGLRWKLATDSDSGEGRTVVYGGGGNLGEGYRDARDFLERHAGRCRRLVLLPHTVEGNEDLLSRLGPETHLFLREETSLDHCKQSAPRANSHLCHDMALTLPRGEDVRVGWGGIASAFLKRIGDPSAPSAKALAMLVQARLRRMDRHGRIRARGAVLEAFRTDGESKGRELPIGNRDLSKAFETGNMDPFWASLSARMLLSYVDGAALVRTDRLHVAISCCLRGVPVELHANSNFKCEAVWKHSLEGRFPNARWMG